MASAQLANLEAFLLGHPSIKYTAPSSPEFSTVCKVWNLARPDIPLAVVHPQNAEDVRVLVQFAKSNGLKFTIRVGGHNMEGRALVDDALVIDLRALTGVKVAEDRQSATVEGGILQGELGTKLWAEGLATPTGSIPCVGYVGWATYGGYGPSHHTGGWGPIRSLLLRGIRGVGGVFGVIVDLTIKVYPLQSLLAGAILFDSQDITKVFADFSTGYQKLLENGMPEQLTIQQAVFNAPPGRVFAVIVAWSGDDIEEGKHWTNQIAALGPLLMNTVVETTIPEWFTGNAALVPSSVYGSSRTLNLHNVTPEVTEAIGRNLTTLPSDPGTMMSVHQLRGPSAAPKGSSVFATREPHYMLEILGFATVENRKEEAEKWASDIAEAISETDAGNILPTTYISLYSGSERGVDPLGQFYGSHTEEILSLKKEYDPEDLFHWIVPQLQ
ncbi:D-lactate dehydrogenase [Aspergillus bombycis]|uniref:D-lactate dehydrogenase n=1 Tax=Aspergillus bombycis TaxID=109264 RepID=A0A1F8A1V0_9EURO|nr:D-lactate dehydrogenase [Aspergillus bombycis]OGM45315.1 D-lactate dehydrogenase [Aspergillus bombycis]